jgi:hypothetical protein
MRDKFLLKKFKLKPRPKALFEKKRTGQHSIRHSDNPLFQECPPLPPPQLFKGEPLPPNTKY